MAKMHRVILGGKRNNPCLIQKITQTLTRQFRLFVIGPFDTAIEQLQVGDWSLPLTAPVLQPASPTHSQP